MAGIHLRFTTIDVDAAEAQLRLAYPSVRFGRRPGDEPFIMEQRFDGDHAFNLTRMHFALPSTATVDDTGGMLVLRTRERPLEVTSGRRAVVTERPVVLAPEGPVTSSWQRSDVDALLVPMDVYRRFVSRRVRSDGGPAYGHLVQAPSPELAARWDRFLDYLADGFFRTDAFDNDLIRATTEELCVTMMLASFFPDGAHRPVDGRGAMPDSVHRALAYIDDHAPEPITIGDIADAGRLSTRGLQAAFRRHLDTTPLERLRAVRLNGARRALLDPADDVTVASVAAAWGFTHQGRFAGGYRELFGETPSRTLIRARS
ncbi:helix-turn-helix transcriptional regulator [Agromyces sp. MMS24-K17]|uniref:helix-turn-helix transcriptional regulator n=1 Tax=Agromyces sp. MMS24-K17 TaxID=3372850 RepID=UPI00375412A2